MNDQSSFTYDITELDDGRWKYDGSQPYGGIYYHWSLTENIGNPFKHRGTVSAQTPRGRGVMKDGNGNRISVSIEVMFNGGLPPDEIQIILQAAIMDKIRAIHGKYRDVICSQLKLTTTPETITPMTAVELHMNDYWHLYGKTHKLPKGTIKEKYSSEMLSFFKSIPEKSMLNYPIYLIEKALKEQNVTKILQEHLRNFWQFTIDHGISLGKNVIPKPKYEKRE